MKRIALLALLLPLPAAAQDLRFDPGLIDACFARGGWEDCIGTAANACMETSPDGYTTPVMNACLEREYDWWDRELNDAYQRLIAEMQRRDNERWDKNQPSQEEAAREMQRAWIVFRDATCNFEVLGWWGGTGASGAWTGCLMRLTGEQALYLRGAMAQG